MLVAPAVGLWIVGLVVDRRTRTHGRTAPVAVGVATTALAVASPLQPMLGSFLPSLTLHMLVGSAGYAFSAGHVQSSPGLGELRPWRLVMIGMDQGAVLVVGAGISGPTAAAALARRAASRSTSSSRSPGSRTAAAWGSP